MADLLLVAVDFEEASRKAVELAKQLAKPLSAEVVLCHVYQLPVYTYPGFEPIALPSMHAEVTAAAKRALQELSASHGGLRTMLRDGDAATEILGAAEEAKATMIVMGTHGRRGIAHLLLGSVAEKVVRRSPIPVLTVRG